MSAARRDAAIALSHAIAEVRRAAWRAQEGICAMCGHPMGRETRKRIPRAEMELQPTAQHVIPQGWPGCANKVGGNIVAAHWRCNHDHGHKPPTGCHLVWLMAVNARLGFQPVRW
jgi:5-methylcytosine-specific restriction endonuclease McrA